MDAQEPDAITRVVQTQAADLIIVTADLAHLRALLAPAPELLERAAEHCEWTYASANAPPRPRGDVAALRELAQALREAGVGEEKEGEET